MGLVPILNKKSSGDRITLSFELIFKKFKAIQPNLSRENVTETSFAQLKSFAWLGTEV